MSVKFNSLFGSDPKKETEGVWVEFAPGFKIKLARIGHPEYTDYLQKLMKPYKRQLRNDSLPAEIAKNCVKKALAKHIILGWEGLIDDLEKPIDFTAEKALELLKSSDDFFNEIIEMAKEREVFSQEDDEESRKN